MDGWMDGWMDGRMDGWILRGTWHPVVFSSNKWIARQPFWADASLNCPPTYAQERQIIRCYQDSFFAKLRDHCSNLPTSISAFNSFKGFRGFRRFRGFRGLRAGKRQAWTPIRSLRSHCCGLGVPVGVDRAEEAIDVALGCLLAAIA